jgi:hypothetical protein
VCCIQSWKYKWHCFAWFLQAQLWFECVKSILAMCCQVHSQSSSHLCELWEDQWCLVQMCESSSGYANWHTGMYMSQYRCDSWYITYFNEQTSNPLVVPPCRSFHTSSIIIYSLAFTSEPCMGQHEVGYILGYTSLPWLCTYTLLEYFTVHLDILIESHGIIYYLILYYSLTL